MKAYAVPATSGLTARAVPNTTLPATITPDRIETEGIGSVLVCTVTSPPCVEVVLIVNPESVTVTAVLALSTAFRVVMMTEVALGEEALPVAPPLIATAVVALVAKKPGGYDSVMLLPAASAPPAVVVNEMYAAAPVLPEMRSA